ncbi:MAG: P-loop NTPase [Phycisphaerae bacterium]|nr:P-loop NTPase [Phycisphaerae bacterium]
MKIAITSGKGGVGKTLVATCLAGVLAESENVRYIDCDVEAPNSHLFLKPDKIQSEEQTLPCIEGMDPKKCTLCGLCAKVCYFNAIVAGKKNAMAFPELCRWCGACQIVCPHDALIVNKRTIGTVYHGQVGKIDLHWATLQAGAGGMTVRLIEQIKQCPNDKLTILDSPPGTSCAVVHTIQDADIVVLVADPTRFGQHDLKLSVHLCHSMNIEPLVLVNRSGIGDLEALRRWCASEKLPILTEIPDDRQIAELYSKGLLPIEHLDYLRPLFSQAARKIAALPEQPKNKKIRKPILPKTQTIFLNSDNSLKITDEKTPSTNPIEITIVSGKGGTGKTSLAACFAQLEKTVVADCDVDAADMHLLFEPKVLESQEFIGGRVMSIDPRQCSVCGNCIDICQWDAISRTNNTVTINEDNCEGCGACVLVCLTKAIKTKQTHDGKWYWSATRHGHMSHAVLEPGKENSGKLVTLVRKNAAQKTDLSKDAVVVLDGSPGTGCPVIASVGGAKAAVIVTEPTVSGLHDLIRILELTEHFKIPAGVIINKADINPQVSEDIKKLAQNRHAVILGQLPYDPVFVQAQQEAKTILEYEPNSELSKKTKDIWKKIKLMCLQ